MMIIYILLAIAVGAGACYLILQPRIKTTAIYNKTIEKENQQLEKSFKELTEKTNEAQAAFENLANSLKLKEIDCQQIETKIKVLEAKREEIQRSLEVQKQQLEETYNGYREKERELLQTYYDKYVDQFNTETQRWKNEAMNEYFNTLQECVENYQLSIAAKENELKTIETKITDLRSKQNAMIEAQKREVERQEKKDFYRIQISNTDIYEIEHLRQVIPFLRNSRPVCKIIWESYYRNPTSDMVGRILGTETHTGIYKITHPDTGLAYVGQAVNVGDRWKEHVKCGLGIDTPANKLYAAMQKYGVENFTFELLEDCPRAQLNEREKYYIELYKTQEWGWNQTKGGSAGK